MTEDSKTGRTLVPERTVKLVDGRLVTIRPWSWAVGRLLGPRVAELARRLRGIGTADLATLVMEAQDEVAYVIRETLGWDEAELERLAYEDIFTLAQAIFETSILRPDPEAPGRPAGAVGKLLGLAGLTPADLLAQAVTEARRKRSTNATKGSPAPSSSSSPTGTRTAMSDATRPTS